jgi:Domain of Unknown Function (DUF1080)
MRPILVALFLGVFASAVCAEIPTKTVALLNGKDLAGWEYVTPNKEAITSVCHIKADGTVAVDGKPNGFIATTGTYENYRMHAEWRWTDKPGNSGVLVHISDGPMDRIWPISFQIQTKVTRVGDLLPMSTAKFAEPLTPDIKTPTLNRLNADNEKPVGQWNSCDIDCRGGTIEVSINGMPQNRVTKCVPASGKVGFQLEGVPFEIRNVRLDPLKPAIDGSLQMPDSSGSRGLR